MTSGRWEKVHAIHDYHDGPVGGVADVGGAPHVFEQIFSEEKDEYSDRYRVMEIDQELYSRIMEAWAIFVRWRVALDGGRTTLKTHPALPEDRERYLDLEQVIGNRRKPYPDRSRVVGARFRRVDSGPSYVLGQWEVQWQD